MLAKDGCLAGFTRQPRTPRVHFASTAGSADAFAAPSAVAAPSASSAVAATDAANLAQQMKPIDGATTENQYWDSEEECVEPDNGIWRNLDHHPLNAAHEVGNFGIYFGNWGMRPKNLAKHKKCQNIDLQIDLV